MLSISYDMKYELKVYDKAFTIMINLCRYVIQFVFNRTLELSFLI